jgi:hypothetical protein
MTALVVGAIALLVAAFTLWGNARARDDRSDLRRRLEGAEGELETCNRDRIWMRQRLQIVEASLLALLPEKERFALMHELSEALPDPENRAA